MFERTLKVIDKDILDKIRDKRVLLVGVGGVGGFALESLVRLGFLNITIIDNDVIDKSNLNRQIISLEDNIGEYKTDIAKVRAININSEVKIKNYNIFLNEDNIEDIFKNKYDFIIDACDTLTTKFLLIKKAKELGIKIISCMGTGNRINPSLVAITKLSKTYNDPLAKRMREILKKNKLSLNTPVIWSKEIPVKTKDRTPGSIVLVPGMAGLLSTYYILEEIKNESEKK